MASGRKNIQTGAMDLRAFKCSQVGKLWHAMWDGSEPTRLHSTNGKSPLAALGRGCQGAYMLFY